LHRVHIILQKFKFCNILNTVIYLKIIHKQEIIGIISGITSIVNENINKGPKVDSYVKPDFIIYEEERVLEIQTEHVCWSVSYERNQHNRELFLLFCLVALVGFVPTLFPWEHQGQPGKTTRTMRI
jgi:hypothetical protein